MQARFLLVVAAAALLGACQSTDVTQGEMNSVDYGPPPADWKQSVRSYLDIRLPDPKSAIVEFRSEPQKMYQKAVVPITRAEWGWAVCVAVEEKPTDGFYPMTFFFRDGRIVTVHGGPGEYIVGGKYAREQCARLGVTFR